MSQQDIEDRINSVFVSNKSNKPPKKVLNKVQKFLRRFAVLITLIAVVLLVTTIVLFTLFMNVNNNNASLQAKIDKLSNQQASKMADMNKWLPKYAFLYPSTMQQDVSKLADDIQVSSSLSTQIASGTQDCKKIADDTNSMAIAPPYDGPLGYDYGRLVSTFSIGAEICQYALQHNDSDLFSEATSIFHDGLYTLMQQYNQDGKPLTY